MGQRNTKLQPHRAVSGCTGTDVEPDPFWPTNCYQKHKFQNPASSLPKSEH